ncbi:hypothetical protein F4604DRAFT_1955685 [Suillus subluteus]|nr:hypothetical protein F4604DRAFT_1955685 [Suillus subluteus]
MKAKYSVRGTSQGALITVGCQKCPEVVRAAHLKQKEREAFHQWNHHLRSLDIHQRERFFLAEQAAQPADDPINFSTHFSPQDDAYPMDIISAIPPAGAEGIELSHTGGEYELYSELNNMLTMTSKRYDHRDRTNQIVEMAQAWASQYEDLTDAYLQYMEEQPSDVSDDEANQFTIEVINIFDRSICIFRHTSAYLNVSLMREGCIGASPIKPTVAITIRTLEVYRQTHHVSMP